MAIGETLCEGKGKSGASFIKSIDINGMASMYTWTAQLKGIGKAKCVDCNLNVTGVSMTPQKGLATSTDQGMIMTMTGDMGTIKGYDLNEDGARHESNKRRFMEFYERCLRR